MAPEIIVDEGLFRNALAAARPQLNEIQFRTLRYIALAAVTRSPCHLFISGAAGSGKSSLLDELTAFMQRVGLALMVVSPQAIAAENVGGLTIHSALKLNRHGDPTKASFAAVPTERFSRQLVFAIDEVSMLNDKIFSTIELILRRSARNSMPFGGAIIVVLGDLMQLPPIKPQPVYYSPLWREFKLIGLRQNLRQANDPEFLENLNKIRTGADGAGACIQWFNEKALFKSQEERHSWRDVPCISSLTRDVAAINRARLAEALVKLNDKSKEVVLNYTVAPLHTRPPPAGRRPVEMLSSMAQDMRVCPGVVVMFSVNDPSGSGGGGRYTNGTVGTVEECRVPPGGGAAVVVIRTANGGEPIRLSPEKIEFEMPAPGTWFFKELQKRTPADQWGRFSRATGVAVLGYPLTYGWARTIHKIQGITLDRVVVNPVGIFAAGQLYVALSRATSIAGLRLANPIIERHLVTSSEALDAYEDMGRVDTSSDDAALPDSVSPELAAALTHNAAVKRLLEHGLDAPPAKRYHGTDLANLDGADLDEELADLCAEYDIAA